MAKNQPKQRTRPQDIEATAAPLIERFERLDDEKKVFNETVKDDQNEIVAEAELAGIAPKAFRRTLRMRKLKRTLRELPDKLDIDEAAQFSALAEAFGGTEFGQHIRERLDALREPPPSPTASRPDEEHLQHIGQGRQPARSDEIDNLTF